MTAHGGGMDRSELDRLLAGNGTRAAEAAREALGDTGNFAVWEGAVPARHLARIYGRRLRHTRRTGQRTLGLEDAVNRLDAHRLPVSLGQITAEDRSWHFVLFLTEGHEEIVSCTGVRTAEPEDTA
ncbi:hypothetical protein [Streptomyces sp. ODS28]|uniref:hypothetical protein n=1 Tax=Streptomyces sp. ODS28 TaxID=3136688 RepID=UPI0031E8270F